MIWQRKGIKLQPKIGCIENIFKFVFGKAAKISFGRPFFGDATPRKLNPSFGFCVETGILSTNFEVAIVFVLTHKFMLEFVVLMLSSIVEGLGTLNLLSMQVVPIGCGGVSATKK